MSGGPLTVRAIRPQDLQRVWELVLELAAYERLRDLVNGTPERLGELLFGDRPGFEGLVAEQGGRLVGYALVYSCWSSFRTRRRLWLEDIYVEEPARGGGAGRALLRGVARLAIERGCDRLDWAVLDWNQAAIDFYLHHGARPSGGHWLQYGLDEPGLRVMAERA